MSDLWYSEKKNVKRFSRFWNRCKAEAIGEHLGIGNN